MTLVVGHRGHNHLETVVRGRQAHGGNPWQGKSAIALAGELISYLYGRYPGARAADSAAVVGTTSVNIGTIKGGEQFNIVAGLCRFDWELRPAPGTDGTALIEDFARHCRGIELLHAASGVQVSVQTALLESYPEYRSDSDSPSVALVRRLTGINTMAVVGYGTEAPFYQERGLSVVIFGPGSIDQAHQPNEYIEIAQLRSYTAFVLALAQHLSA